MQTFYLSMQMPNAHGEEELGPVEEFYKRQSGTAGRRGPTIGSLNRPIYNEEWKIKSKRRMENLMRLQWYLREYGRPPTYDEIVALRDKDYIR